MSRCEDFPCCGHERGDCPTRDSQGRLRWTCVECGKRLPVDATSSMVAHVEAGLRTSDIDRPFPEEANRQIISPVAKLHLAPTIDAKVNLLSEGIASHAFEVTGNTVVDAIEMLRPRIESTQLIPPVPAGTSLVLVTAHRRENLGRPMVAICNALRELADTRTDLHIVFVMHPNPAARATAEKRLARQERIIAPCTSTMIFSSRTRTAQ